jgi:phenol hydroxylase P1 protein
MLTEFMRLWFAESQRWVDALLKTVVAESAANKSLVQGWVDHWRHRSVEALLPLAGPGPIHRRWMRCAANSTRA